MRIDQGRQTESTFRVSGLEDPRRIASPGLSTPFRIACQLEPRERETRLTFTFELARLELHLLPFERLIPRAVQDGAEHIVRKASRPCRCRLVSARRGPCPSL